MKKFKQIAKVVFIVMYFPIVFSFVLIEKNNLVCSTIEPAICDSADNKFITSSEVRNLVIEKYPGLLGRQIDEVSCEEMEVFFRNHPAIQTCEAYFTHGGALHVDVIQREPLVRVFGNLGSYYLDTYGQRMPLFTNHTAHVLVASGYLARLKSEKHLVALAQKIYNDPFWKAQIEQIYVDENGHFILVPRVGVHIIEFGSIYQMDEKFRNLYALYTHGWDAREWNLYTKVNLKYNGQIVCTK